MAKRASRKTKKKAAVKKKKVLRRKPKKAAARKRKAVKKKKAVKRTPKKKTAAKKRRAKSARPKRAKRKPARKPGAAAATRRAPKPAFIIPPPHPSAPPVPAANEQKIGRVIHYYSHLGVAVVRVERGNLGVGDTIHIQGHTSNFRQRVESMEVEHDKIPRAAAGQEFGLKVIEHAREHDLVFKVV